MRSESRAALWLVVALSTVGLLAPLLANDRPILARLDGRLVAPAAAEIPLVGLLFDQPGARSRDWAASPPPGSPGPAARVLLMPPVPYSYRGIRLDEALHPPGRAHLLGTDALGADAPGAGDAAQGLYDLAARIGAPVALKAIGMPADGLDRAARLATEHPYANPRPIEYAGVRQLLDEAYRGTRPAAAL